MVILATCQGRALSAQTAHAFVVIDGTLMAIDRGR